MKSEPAGPGTDTRRLEPSHHARGVLRMLANGILLLILVGAGLAPSIAHDTSRYHPGKFVWFDLVTDDLASAQQFYGAIFGWRFRTIGPEPGRYTLIEDAGGQVGGMFFRSPRAGATRAARWLSLISVEDPAKTVRYVEQQGGSVIVPPARIAGRGTVALFRDPQGAVFGVQRSDAGDPPDTPVEDGDFFWVDLLTSDPAQATSFYTGLAHYEVSERELAGNVKRIVLASDNYARASIAPLPERVRQPGWLPYVLVSDVAGTLEKAVAAGGSVLVEPRADLLDGNLAVIADPRGGVVGIVNWVADIPAEGGER